jgi:hypothetical protein
MRRLGILLVLAASPAGAASIMVQSDACAVLADTGETPGVAYTPGVDAQGRAVAPADLPGSSIQVTAFPVEITRSLAGKYGIPGSGEPFGAELRLGYVVVDDKGRVTFNGQPLDPEARAVVAEACRRRLGR